MKRRPRERGVSAIEALAALALIAIVMIPLLDLQISLVRAGAAQEAAARRIEARRNALALIRDLNPMANPEGSRPLTGDLTMRWSARALADETRGLDYPSGEGPFVVTLYLVTVSLTGQGVDTSFRVEMLGWRKAEDDGQPRAGSGP